jgi:hypothetical protein
MLESGDLKSLHEISPKEGLDSSYVSRMVNLTTLAPDIVAAILDETLPPDVTVFYLAVDPPLLWEGQRRRIRMPISHRPHNLDILNQGGRFHEGRAREALGCLISLIPWPHGGHYTSRAGGSRNGGITIKLTLKCPNTGCSVRVDN